MIFEVIAWQKGWWDIHRNRDTVIVHSEEIRTAQGVALKHWSKVGIQVDTLSIGPAMSHDPLDFGLAAVTIINLPMDELTKVWDAVNAGPEERRKRPEYIVL